MTYDREHLKSIVQKNKRSFLTKLFILIFLVAFCTLLILFSSTGEVIILSGVGIFVCAILLLKLVDKQEPKILFSKEIKGENLKEGEYEIMKRGSYTGNGMRHKQVGGHGIMPYAPNTRANKKAFHKNMHFNGEVYLKTENGDIRLLTGIYGSQLEIYEEGDILLKPGGCKFPIVVSRNSDKRPCPICGEVNGDERSYYPVCGLKILSEVDHDEHKI